MPTFDWTTLLSLSAVAMGHVLYGLPGRGPDRRRVALFNGDDFATTDAAPRPDRLHDVRAVTARGAVVLEAVGEPLAGVSVDVHDVEGPAWLVVETPPTFIELPPEKFDRYLSHEGLTAVREARAADVVPRSGREIYSKHIKVGLRAHEAPFLAASAGLPIEIHLTSAVDVGRAAGFQLRVDGLPAANRQVRVHHKADGAARPREVACLRTDDDGGFPVGLDAPGYWRLHAIDMQPHDDPDAADWRSRWACLVLDL
jgi:hypothetical protein